MILLSESNGGGNQNYNSTCFTPTATTNIVSGTAPFTGSYLPQGDFEDLNGASINGDWKLILSDCCGNRDQNIIKSWSITFQNQNEVQFSWRDSLGLSCVDCPNPIAKPEFSTVYTLTAEDSFGCTHEESVVVEVLNEFSSPDVGVHEMSNGSITFRWRRIPGVPTYEVNVNNEGWIPANGFLEHRVDNLNKW